MSVSVPALKEFRSRATLTEDRSRKITTGLLLLFLVSLASLTLATFPYRLLSLGEQGWGDSYILYDVMHYQETGVIYRDLSQPPYMPAVYSPLVYMSYAVAGHISTENPFLGPRLLALLAFLLCVAMTASIAKVLVPERHARLWGLLLASSIPVMIVWLGQLRGDFPGIFFGLATVRLLLARPRWAVVLAGLAAGLAMQFKVTYVAALGVGCLWLLLRNRWRDLALFAIPGALSSLGLYFVWWLREPGMLSQIFGLTPVIWDPVGCLKLILHSGAEPIVLLALPAVPFVLHRARSRWLLLVMFGLASFFVAAFTDMQAGGYANYFFEALFTLVPVAVLGTFRLIAWSSRQGLALFLAGVIVILFPLSLLDLLHKDDFLMSLPAQKIQNDNFRHVESVLAGRHIFSTIPRLALLDPHPEITEPYLLTYRERTVKFNSEPIIRKIHQQEFEVVITDADPQAAYRGVRRMPPDVEKAIRDAYQPYCTLQGNVLHLPRNRERDSSLLRGLHNINCAPYPAANQRSSW